MLIIILPSLFSCSNERDLEKASLIGTLEENGYEILETSKIDTGFPEGMIEDIDRTVVKKEGVELILDLLNFKKDSKPMSQQAVEFQNSYCKNCYSNRNSRGLVGHVYLVVHAKEKEGIPMAGSTFDEIVQE